jgi:DNA repair protein SbcC/Rad50
MRPLRLEVEGFTCYRDRQPPLNFAEFSLFAIAGPTGAGKSSILDAMLYALFGEVPRIGKHGVSEFISQGRDRMSVSLDFRIRNRDYRVTRASKLTKTSVKTDATLAELTDAGERSLASQVKQVNEEIVRLLGIGYDEFIQTVVLPQGEFARFLKAKPTDQRAILQRLLRHDVFMRMRDLAEERRRDLDAERRSLEGKLSGLIEATAEALASNEAGLAEARVRQSDAVKLNRDADVEAQEARFRRTLTEEVERLRSDRSVLEKGAPSIERARTELELARRANVIAPRLEASRAAAARNAALLETHSKVQGDTKRILKLKDEAADRAAAASEAARVCDALSARLRSLDEITGDVARRAELSANLKSVEQALSDAEKALAGARISEATARQKVQGCETNLREQQTTLREYPFDGALLEKIDESFESVSQGKALQQEIKSLEAEGASCEAERSVAEQKVADAQRSCDTAESAAHASGEHLAEARLALETGKNRDRAAALRTHLHVGDSCPVCLQTVTEVPERGGGPELVSLEQELQKAEVQAAKANRELQSARAVLATDSAKRDQSIKTADAISAKLADRRLVLQGVLKGLLSMVPSGTPVEDLNVLNWMDERRRELRAAKAEKERLSASVRETEAALDKARLALVEAEGHALRSSDHHQRQVEARSKSEADLTATVARIQGVTSHADPLQEREELSRRIASLQEAERNANQALTDATSRAIKAHAELQAAQTAFSDAAAHASAMEEALTLALSEAGFASIDDAVESVRPATHQKELETKIISFDQKRASVQLRLDELQPQVTAREMSADRLAEIEQRSKAAADASRLADQIVAKLETEVARLQKDVEARTDLMSQTDALQKVLAIAAELATDLKGDRFQEFLLEEAFKTLVAGASVRLKTISNRYTLQWESGEFYVVDHDNAGERRRAETLSGGETFMASLCLALQLSDEVLRTSGALQMDSLFIDEGFGTLDSDSLSEVTDAMEALRQDGDRMIGVISHRPEMTERLPGCVRVNKGIGESSWVVERVG